MDELIRLTKEELIWSTFDDLFHGVMRSVVVLKAAQCENSVETTASAMRCAQRKIQFYLNSAQLPRIEGESALVFGAEIITGTLHQIEVRIAGEITLAARSLLAKLSGIEDANLVRPLGRFLDIREDEVRRILGAYSQLLEQV